MSMIELIMVLIVIESGGDLNAVGDNGKAVGVLQIHKEYVDDCNRISQLHSKNTIYTYEDREDRDKSIEMTLLYLEHYCQAYAKKTGKQATPEIAARIHNGGPMGWKRKSTIPYWKKVKVVLHEK